MENNNSKDKIFKDTLLNTIDATESIVKNIVDYIKPDVSNLFAQPPLTSQTNKKSISELRAEKEEEESYIEKKCVRPSRDSLPPLMKDATDKQVCHYLGGEYMIDSTSRKCVPKLSCSGRDMRQNILLKKTLKNEEMTQTFKQYKLLGVPTHMGTEEETVPLGKADFILDCIYSPEHEFGIMTFKDKGKLKCLYRPANSIDDRDRIKQVFL